LAECYQRARQVSETIAISAENIKAFQEQYRAQIGVVLPHIDWIKTQFYQQKIDNSATGIGGSALRSSQPESYFQLQQPIFGGFRDWNAAAIAKSQREQAVQNQRLTDLQLLNDVATAFYTAYTLQDDMTVLEETRKLNQNQINQLKKWANIGRSRPAEVLSAETQGATLDAELEDSRRAWVQARHVLLYLTGVPENVPLADPDHPAPRFTLEEALIKASQRPEVLSAMEDVRQAESGRKYEFGGHYPTLGLLGRYYTERVGFLEAIDWDVTFTLDVPIFAGGSTQANVRAARSKELIARLRLAGLKRDIERQVRTAYDNYTHSLAKVNAYEKAVELAQKNYQTQQKEYRLGVISNLELLRLLSDTQDIRRQALSSRASAKMDDIQLRIVTGEGL
jgi:outer membrane protein